MGTPARPWLFKISVIAGSPLVQSARKRIAFRVENACLTCGVSIAKRSFVLQVRHQSAVKSTNTGCPLAKAFSSESLVNSCQTSWLGRVTNLYTPAASKTATHIAANALIREPGEETGVQKEPFIHARTEIRSRAPPNPTMASTPFI